MSDLLAVIRLDKWLWTARFFKTRALAGAAIKGGKVHINGVRAKASRQIRAGDIMRIHRGTVEFVIIVQALSQRRGPAREAQSLYKETDDSASRRLSTREEQSAQALGSAKRPNKRERRHIIAFTRGDQCTSTHR